MHTIGKLRSGPINLVLLLDRTVHKKWGQIDLNRTRLEYRRTSHVSDLLHSSSFIAHSWFCNPLGFRNQLVVRIWLVFIMNHNKKDELKLSIMKVQNQKDGFSCGLFAIANAIALAFGLNPSKYVYDPITMRSHFVSCCRKR